MTDNVGLDIIAFRKLDIRPSASSPGGSCQHILSTEATYEAFIRFFKREAKKVLGTPSAGKSVEVF